MATVAVHKIGLVEFQADGTPTGTVFVEGVKYTGITATEVGTIPKYGLTNSAQTNILVAYKFEFQQQERTNSAYPDSCTVSVHQRHGNAPVTSGTLTRSSKY